MEASAFLEILNQLNNNIGEMNRQNRRMLSNHYSLLINRIGTLSTSKQQICMYERIGEGDLLALYLLQYLFWCLTGRDRGVDCH